MEGFGFVDYKKPLGKQNDMRTSTYRGHVHITDTMLGNELNPKFGAGRPHTDDPDLEKGRISDYRENFDWKFVDPYDVRNPKLGGKIEFIKPFEEFKMKFIMRPIRPAISTSHEDYIWQPKPVTPPVPATPMPCAIETTKISIDRAKQGYAKYLDPSATTSRLAFVAYTPKELMGGVAAKDNITFWNWNSIHTGPKRVVRDKDPELCDKLPAAKCPKRRCEFPSLVKHVPHTGLTTEVRDNYLTPIKRSLDYKTPNIRNDTTDFTAPPFATNTEYKIIGSGDHTRKYV